VTVSTGWLEIEAQYQQVEGRHRRGRTKLLGKPVSSAPGYAIQFRETTTRNSALYSGGCRRSTRSTPSRLRRSRSCGGGPAVALPQPEPTSVQNYRQLGPLQVTTPTYSTELPPLDYSGRWRLHHPRASTPQPLRWPRNGHSRSWNGSADDRVRRQTAGRQDLGSLRGSWCKARRRAKPLRPAARMVSRPALSGL